MKAMQGCKVVPSLAPVSATGAYTAAAVDCAGYHTATVIICAGVLGVAEDFVALKVQGSNDDSTYGDLTSASITYIAGAAGVASTGINFIGTGQTPVAGDDGKVWFAQIDLRKATFAGATGATIGAGVRYLKLVAESADASLLTCLVVLTDPDPFPGTATARGAVSVQVI